MLKAKNKIENYFEKLGRIFYQNHFKVLIIAFTLVIIFGTQLPRLIVDTSSEALLHQDDPYLLEYNAFRDQFGRDEIILIGIKSQEIFTVDFLSNLKSFHNDLEKKVPYVKKVTSLINARSTLGEKEVLYVDELFKDWPKKNIDLAQVRKFALNNPLYQNNLISEDGNLAAILIETEASIRETNDQDALISGFEDSEELHNEAPAKKHYFSAKESAEVIKAVNTVMDKYRDDDFVLFLSGGPIILHEFNTTVSSDMTFASSLLFLVLIVILSLFFRRVSGIVLPLIIIMSALISIMGIMAILDVRLTVYTNVIGALLMSVGIADAVHILTIFFRQLRHNSNKEEAIVYAMGHSGLAIFLTSLTTAAGFLSFALAELSSIANLGIYAAGGVMLAFFFTVILLPAMIAVTPIKQKKGTEKRSAHMDRVLLAFANFSIAHPGKIVLTSLAIFIISIVCIFNLKFSDDPLSGFPKNSVVRKDVNYIDKNLKGITALEVVIDTNKENGIYSPELLNNIENIANSITKTDIADLFVGKVFSINDIIKETNQALNGNDPDYYRIPQDKNTIAQELFLFENSGSDDLERVVDSQFSKTRITIKTPYIDSVIYKDFMDQVETRFKNEFPEEVDISLTGEMALVARAIPKAIRSMSKSYAIAAIVISIMMMILVRNFKIGLASMFPNLLPIFMVMGLMGLTGVPLDMTTILIASIAIGLVVDDTVHFIYNFQKHFKATGDASKAIRESFLGTGRALLITSAILCSGFLCDTATTLNNFVRFGFFTSLTIFLALIIDFVTLPAMLIMITAKEKKRETASRNYEQHVRTSVKTGNLALTTSRHSKENIMQ